MLVMEGVALLRLVEGVHKANSFTGPITVCWSLQKMKKIENFNNEKQTISFYFYHCQSLFLLFFILPSLCLFLLPLALCVWFGWGWCVLLVLRQRQLLRGFLDNLYCGWTTSKRGVLVRKNSLASCQRCRHGVEPRALTRPSKQNNQSSWSLLSWHNTDAYIWGTFYVVSKLFALHRHGHAKWLGSCQQKRFSCTVSFNLRIHTRSRNMVCRRSGWLSWTGDRTQMRLWLQQDKVDLLLRIVTALKFRRRREETA